MVVPNIRLAEMKDQARAITLERMSRIGIHRMSSIEWTTTNVKAVETPFETK